MGTDREPISMGVRAGARTMMKPITRRAGRPNGPLALVVDDEDQVRFTLASALESKGYSVAQAADGEQALATFQETRPDIILLDLLMPGLNGVQTCARLRALPGGDQRIGRLQ